MILKVASLVAVALSSVVYVSYSFAGGAVFAIGAETPIEGSVYAILVHARNVSSMSPLDPRPFLVTGLLKERSGDAQTARRLISQAIRRDPRMTDARFWMLRHHFSAGDIQSGVQEARILYQLRPRMARQISALLVEASRDPGTRKIVAHGLANTPYILDVVGHASAAGLPSSSLLELVSATDLRVIPGAVRSVQSAVIRGPLDQGQYREARQLWGRVVGRQTLPTVIDGSFTGAETSPPFAWTISTGSTIEAQIGPNAGQSAIRVRFFGDLATTVASQMLVLDPGVYRLTYHASAMGDWTNQGPAFEWRIQCTDSAELSESPVQPRSRSWRLESTRFSVPAGCLAQTLELRSTGNYPNGTPEVRITGVEVHQTD